MASPSIPVELLTPIVKKAINCKELVEAVDEDNEELTRDKLAECIMTDIELMRLLLGEDCSILGAIPTGEDDDEFRKKVKAVAAKVRFDPPNSQQNT